MFRKSFVGINQNQLYNLNKTPRIHTSASNILKKVTAMTSSSASSIQSASTTDSFIAPRPGLLWVTTSVRDPSLTTQTLHDWYDEHTIDYLNTPSNGRLFLRYRNIDTNVSSYADPEYASRFTAGNEGKVEKEKAWPFLALLRLDDVMWLASKDFADMSRHSSLLPSTGAGAKDGKGSAFDAFHAGLRSYVVLHRKRSEHGGSKRPKYILSLQTAKTEGYEIDNLLNSLAKINGFKGFVTYKNLNGIFPFQEPGTLPDGLILAEFDGEVPPRWEDGLGIDVVRADVWELINEVGDLSLEL